jgi:hypothetical protein
MNRNLVPAVFAAVAVTAGVAVVLLNAFGTIAPAAAPEKKG